MHSERHSAPRLVHEEFGVGSPSGLSPSALRLVDELKSSRSGPKGLRVEDTRRPQVESLTAGCIWLDPERQLGAIA